MKTKRCQHDWLKEEMISKLVQQVEATCLPYLDLIEGVHGLEHLRRVALSAGVLAKQVGADVESCVVGGFLHDCARTGDESGTAHALHSAIQARVILDKHYPHLDAYTILFAIQFHADGKTTGDPITACIWDADRLDLQRLGRTIDKNLLSNGFLK